MLVCAIWYTVGQRACARSEMRAQARWPTAKPYQFRRSLPQIAQIDPDEGIEGKASM